MTANRGLAGVAAVTLLGLCACAGEPPVRPEIAETPAPASARAQAYDQAVRQAAAAERAERWREALWRWRVAEAVEPAPGVTVSALVRVQACLDAEAARDLRQGQAAAAQGRPGEARAAFIAVLDLDPSDPTARRALRAMDARDMLVRIVADGAGGPGHNRPALHHRNQHASASRLRTRTVLR